MTLGRRWKRRLFDHWIVALVSLLISVVLWVTVVGGEKIETTKILKIQYKLPDNYIISNQAASELSVRVRGPRAFLNELLETPVSYLIDLREKEIGQIELKIDETKLKLPLGIDVVSMNPQKVKVTLDRVVFKRVPVKPILSKQLADEYSVSSLVAQPSTVELRGSRSKLNYIHSIPTKVILITENLLQQSFDVDLDMDDMPGVKLVEEDPQIRVDVSVEGPSIRKFFRALPVALKVGNKSSLKTVNIRKKRLRMNPGTVDLYLEGPDKVLEKLKRSDVELWVHLPSLKSGVHNLELVWKLPPDLSVVKRSADKIRLVIP